MLPSIASVTVLKTVLLSHQVPHSCVLTFVIHSSHFPSFPFQLIFYSVHGHNRENNTLLIIFYTATSCLTTKTGTAGTISRKEPHTSKIQSQFSFPITIRSHGKYRSATLIDFKGERERERNRRRWIRRGGSDCRGRE